MKKSRNQFKKAFSHRLGVKILVLFVLTVILIGGAIPKACAAGSNSVYLQLSADQIVSGGPTTILTTTVNVTSGGYVYAQADGRYFNAGAGTLGIMTINIDGVRVGNGSVLEWARSTNPQQHSFNVIASTYLNPGNHTIALVGSGSGSFYVGANTGLAVMTNAAANIVSSVTTQDSGIMSFTTQGIMNGTPLPHTQILQNSVTTTTTGPIIALASGRSYAANTTNLGDALWGLYFDGVGEHNDSSTWSDNDIYTGAELQAPFYNQGFFTAPAGNHLVSLGATELPYDNPPVENQVNYIVGADTRLITLNGGMNVLGKAPVSTAVNNRTDYVCVGSNQNWPGCPPVGTDVVLDDTYVTIPQGHNGVVLFMTKTRVQADQADQGGTASTHLVIDGNVVGNIGVQQLLTPNSVSTRTICASYLATGYHPLTPGQHHVQVIGRADGSFIHLAMTRDLPLMWFD